MLNVTNQRNAKQVIFLTSFCLKFSTSRSEDNDRNCFLVSPGSHDKDGRFTKGAKVHFSK